MKYFVISDVHGEYESMIRCLNENGYDKENADHTLITLGDMFDRGKESSKVLDYLLSLEQVVMLKGSNARNS